MLVDTRLKERCTQPHAPIVHCVMCDKEVKTCTSKCVQACHRSRCGKHDGVQLVCGGWVCGDTCWATAFEHGRGCKDKEPLPVTEFVGMQSKSDCLLACVATITGLPVLDMPQPPVTYERLASGAVPTPEDCDSEVTYGNAVQRYLMKNGWLMLNTWLRKPKGLSIASGTSPRNPEIWHCVVCVDGVMVHDPHEDGRGLLSVEQYEVLVPLT